MNKMKIGKRLLYIIEKAAACALICALVLSLAGCEFSVLEVDSYMRPPAASGYSAGIQQALNEALGTQFTLRYPRSGSYRSAVVLAEIDGNEGDEAVVFYRMSTENTGAHMMVLSCVDDDSWQVVGEVEYTGGEIDRIMLCDINGDGSRELVSGWSGLSDWDTINVHSISDGALAAVSIAKDAEGSVPANEYSEMVVGDFDSDGCDELMTVCRSPAEGASYARMLKLGFGANGSAQLSVVGSAVLDGSIYTYQNAQTGTVAEGVSAMIIDGCRSNNSYTTEIVCWDRHEGQLAAPLNDFDTHTALFSRSLATLSRDIDADGVIELPGDVLLPGYKQESENPMYLTVWFSLAGNDVVPESQAVMRSDQGYYFVFPDEWCDFVTVQVDSSIRTMYFFDAETAQPFSSELFRIKIFTRDEWSKRDKEQETTVPSESVDYFRLAVTDCYVYAALMMPGAFERGISEDAVINQFHIE